MQKRHSRDLPALNHDQIITETKPKSGSMASLATHFSAFVLLSPVGVCRLLCSSSHYLRNPSLFRAKTWYFSDPKWKNFDLYTLLIALPIASFSEIFIFLAFSGGHPTYRFAFFQQSATLFLFWLLLLLIICQETLDHPIHIDQAFIFALAAVTFFAEYSVIGKGISGLSGSMYDMLGALTLACAFSCLYLSFRPRSFFAEFLFSSGLVLKGTWMLQLGLSLYTDTFGLKGCMKMSVWPKESVNAEFKCDLEEDGLRGLAVMRLGFIGHAIGVMVLSFVIFGWLAMNWNWRCGEASGPLLQEPELEHRFMLMCGTSREIEVE